MKTYKIKIGKRSLSTLYFCVNENSRNREEAINQIVESVPYNSSIRYADFKNKSALKKYLSINNSGFDSDAIHKLSKNKDAAITTIRKAIKKCVFILPIDSRIHLFVLPSFNSFVKKKMGGVGGYVPWKNTILISIYPTKKWKSMLAETVAHEFAHVISLKHNNWGTLLDSIVFEGLAEHFREDAVGGNISPWAGALSEKNAKRIFNKIRNRIHSNNYNMYRELFFSNKKYPLWSGYSIGYYIVKEYLKSAKRDWKEVFKMKPIEILKQTTFYFPKHQVFH